MNYVDPTGLYGIPGQFYTNMRLTNNDWHRSFRCIDWGDVGISAIMGALGPTFFGNVIGKNLGPLGVTRAQNILGYFGYALPKGALMKAITPKLTIADSCECKGLGVSQAISIVVGP